MRRRLREACPPGRRGRARAAALSVGDLEQEAALGARSPRADDAPERACDAPLPPYDLPDILRSDMEMEDDRVVSLLCLDADGIRVVDESPGEPLEKLSHRLRRLSA